MQSQPRIATAGRLSTSPSTATRNSSDSNLLYVFLPSFIALAPVLRERKVQRSCRATASLARGGKEQNATPVAGSKRGKERLFGSGIGFTDRGAHSLKGVPGEWRLFSAQ